MLEKTSDRTQAETMPQTEQQASQATTPKMSKSGLLIVYTGDGKGKTTAALGMALRAAGYGWKIAIVQFIKGSWKYGELKSIPRLAPEIELHVAGSGFVGIVDDTLPREEHKKAAQEALRLAQQIVSDNRHRLVILDELNIATDLGLVTIQQLLELVDSKPAAQHLVITGRNAAPALIERADLVTEMKEIKHPYQKGLLAQKGIDF